MIKMARPKTSALIEVNVSRSFREKAHKHAQEKRGMTLSELVRALLEIDMKGKEGMNPGDVLLMMKALDTFKTKYGKAIAKTVAEVTK
jgi:hypothetical protein